VISSFRREVNENFTVAAYFAASSGNSLSLMVPSDLNVCSSLDHSNTHTHSR
jgi:hypothetical protein